RRVRRGTITADQLRVQREAHAGDRGELGGRVPVREAHGAHELGFDGMIQERRIVTQRLHERPDDSWTIEGALATGAYDTLRAVLAKGDPADVQEQVKLSGLRGRGGAGFPTAQKWSFLPPDTFPRYLVVNADEGEPSTFKDRMLLERDPHQLIEGIAISAYAIRCNVAYVYIRGEF